MENQTVKISIAVTTPDGDTIFSEEHPNVPLKALLAPGMATPGALTVAAYLTQVALGYSPTDPV